MRAMFVSCTKLLELIFVPVIGIARVLVRLSFLIHTQTLPERLRSKSSSLGATAAAEMPTAGRDCDDERSVPGLTIYIEQPPRMVAEPPSPNFLKHSTRETTTFRPSRIVGKALLDSRQIPEIRSKPQPSSAIQPMSKQRPLPFASET
jgi:hypothetical protein